MSNFQGDERSCVKCNDCGAIVEGAVMHRCNPPVREMDPVEMQRMLREYQKGLIGRTHYVTAGRDLLLEFALRAPPPPEWFMDAERPPAKTQAFGPGYTPAYPPPRDSEFDAWLAKRLASWPWAYARMVLDARPKASEHVVHWKKPEGP